MKLISFITFLTSLLGTYAWSASPVPYSGKVAIDGINFNGHAQFTFSLHDGNGISHWRNGADANQSIQVFVRNGRYSVLLGGQGMNIVPPELFLNHDKLYLRVKFDNGDGVGLRHLAPDQLITATPRALVAEWAKMAKLAERVPAGSITREMLSQQVLTQLDANGSSPSVGPITRDMLPASVLNDLNKTIVITRDMLPQDVQDDLNQSVLITRDMLPQDVQDDLNRTVVITRQMLPADVLNDLNHSISAGSISLDMLAPEVRSDLNRTITRSMLGSDVLADLNKTITITRDMLPQDVRDDLNKSVTITRDMLPVSVLADLNRTVTKSMLGSDVLADLNKTVTITRDMLPQDVKDDLNKTVSITRDMLPADVIADLNKSSTTASPITLSMLAPEVTAKLDQNATIGASSITKSMLAQEVLNDLNGSTTVVNPPAVGSTLAVPRGESAPAGYSLYHQVGQPKELVWQEKATVSIARGVYDGVEHLNDKIYLVGGRNFTDSINYNTSERYNPINNTWETIASMSSERGGIAAATFLNKLYAIGGRNSSNNYHSSVEIFDPSTDAWISGPSLPNPVAYASAIIGNGILYLVGGVNSSGNDLDQILKLDADSGLWTALNQMPTARHNFSSVWYKDRIWVIGGKKGETKLNTVESYDPVTDSWNIETPIFQNRLNPVSWVHSDYIYVGGGHSGSYLNSIDFYDPVTKQWSSAGNFPENKYAADAVVLNDQVYVIAGLTASGVYSNKVFAADLNASVEGVYDLYRKDGNASAGTPIVQAEVADGSVTASKMADGSVTSSKIASNTITTSDLSEQILKYLKPEITAQPQAQTVYADSNVSFSVTAEGKYLTYQWKKDGSNLTGENNTNLYITDANATLHDGNYSVVVSNDFGSVESGLVEVFLSTWTPSIISNLQLWLDASDLTTAESTWTDKSSNGNHATKHNTPTVITSFQNGLSVMRYDKFTNAASTDYHEWNDINDIRTVFALFKRDSGNDGAILTDDLRHDFYTPTGTLLYAESHSNVKNGLYKINGTSITATSTNYPASLSIAAIRSTGNVEASRIGRDRNVNRNHFDGDYGELLIYDSALSDSEIAKIEGYLAHKWGLTANLPANHPYKNTAP